MKAFLVNGVFMFAALACLTSIFIGISDAQVSAVASFNDPRCDGQMVCPNDPLLFTCTVTDSPSALAEVRVSPGMGVQVTSNNMIQAVGAGLPDGVTVQSNNSVVDGTLVNYTLTLAIERASLLGSNPVICDARTVSPLTDEKSCPIATDPGPPVGLSQNVSFNTETSAVVQWGSPTMTGGSGVNISEYTVTVDGGMNQTVSHDDSGGVFTATITVPQFNTSYSVSVTAINSCGLSSQPATTTVVREARVPPRPQNVSLSMECSMSDVRSVNISWMNGTKEDGIMYPGQQTAMVVLTPGDIDCLVTGTRCTASITDGNYTLSLTLSNDIGSSEPVIHSFNSMALLTEDNLDGDEPSVNVTVNENCSNAYMYSVSVSFGVREENGSIEDCVVTDVVNKILMPRNSNLFKVNKTKVPLIVGEEYCFDVSFQDTTKAPPTEPTTEPKPLLPGEIAGIAIGVGAFFIGIVIGFIIGFIVYRNKRKVPQSDQEMKHLSSSASDPGSPVARDAAAVSRETGEVLYTEVDPNRTTEQVQPGLVPMVYQDPNAIEHQEGPSGDLYAMPLTSGKKGKKEKKKGKGREEEAEQQEELTEEEKAAMYSVPDKKAQKAKSQGLTYADIDIQRSTKPAPPSQGSYYADIKL